MIQILWGSESEGVREKKMNMYMYIILNMYIYTYMSTNMHEIRCTSYY